ncbi:hypothetical protein GGI16_003252, partial [Coemansia sp. S142-1]
AYEKQYFSDYGGVYLSWTCCGSVPNLSTLLMRAIKTKVGPWRIGRLKRLRVRSLDY